MKNKISIFALILILCLFSSCSFSNEEKGEENNKQNEEIDDFGDVNFTDCLFGESIEENFYNYCPSAMIDGNTMHIWYCSNKESGNVTDYIAYRKATLHNDGKWSFSEKELVLSHGEGTWDLRHVCDPTVIKGEFNYQEDTYFYLMAYLGCKTDDCTCNEVGLAVSKNPEGPWIKYDKNPICCFYESKEYKASSWGYGQPSLVSVDKKGKILLFYTKGVSSGTHTYVEEWDFSNLNKPILLNEKRISASNIGTINNADFAYDDNKKRFYFLKEDHNNGWYPSDGGVDWITDSNTLCAIALFDDEAYVGETLFASYIISEVATVGQEQTGFPRNHNAGILRDPYGWIVQSESISIIYTKSELLTDYQNWSLGGQWPALHTYRLYGYNFIIK